MLPQPFSRSFLRKVGPLGYMRQEQNIFRHLWGKLNLSV